MKFQMLFCVSYRQHIATDPPQPTLNFSFFAENTGCLNLNKTITGKIKKNNHQGKKMIHETPHPSLLRSS